MKTVTLHLLENGKGTVSDEACCLLTSSHMFQECEVSHSVCDFLLYNSLCWVSKEIVLLSALSKDLPGLKFSCNEIAREKREGLIQQN